MVFKKLNTASCAVSISKTVREQVCHSALDAESSLLFLWIPAFAGMTIHKMIIFNPRLKTGSSSYIVIIKESNYEIFV